MSMGLTTFVALLRGINVGGKNVIAMKDLRDVLSQIGLKQIQTYIQSGNVVFQSEAVDKDKLSSAISAAIEQSHGFTPSVHILNVNQLNLAISNNPFDSHADDPKSVHLYFLAHEPEEQKIEAAAALAHESEVCKLVGNTFYLYAPNGVARSKLARSVEKVLGVSATARNLRSANKILELAQKVAA